MSFSPPEEEYIAWEQTYLTTENPNKSAPLMAWLYRWTAPKDPPLTAHLRVREAARRGRLASIVGLAFLLILIVFFIANYVGAKNPTIMVAIPGLWVSILVALGGFNRKGHSNIAGAILAGSLNLALAMVILSSPGGIGPGTLLLFDMLVIVELIVGSTLPVWWIWLPWLFNSSFISFVLVTWAKTPALEQALASEFVLILARSIGLHFIITVVVLLWVMSATKAIERADNATMVAKLEHNMAVLQRREVDEKERLQEDLGKIMEAFQQLANGRPDTRVQLEQGRPLWSLANTINNWFSRFQRGLESEQEVMQLRQYMSGAQEHLTEARHLVAERQRFDQAITVLSNELIRSFQQRRPFSLSRTETSLDTLIEHLNGRVLISSGMPSPQNERW